MEVRPSRPALSLRVKLVLSYLIVALGAILLLVIVVSLAVQNYFYQAQQDQLRAEAEYTAQYIGRLYQSSGENWDNLPLPPPGFSVVVDKALQIRNPSPPGLPPVFDISAFTQPLRQAVQGQEVQGNLQFSSDNNGTLPG